MKIMWCWRCKMEIPMLDENEWKLIYPIWSNAISTAKEKRIFEDTPEWEQLARPALDEYKELTGYEETNFDALFHHLIFKYGEPCENCGKPLRTPEAAFCAACGQVKVKK
jgi:hypothetical protein